MFIALKRLRATTLYLVTAFCLAGLYLFFIYPTPEFPIYNKDDGALFVTMALNMVNLGRYTVDTFPYIEYGRHATWPPVFPASLALVIALFGHSWWAIKLLMVSFAGAALSLLFALWSDEREGRAAVFITALSPAFFLFAHHPMSELAYLCLIAATLMLLSKTRHWRMALLAGAVASMAFFTRGYAVTFVPAAILYFALQREISLRERLLSALAFAVPLVLSIIFWKFYTGYIVANYPVDAITSHFGTGSGMLGSLFRDPVSYLQRFWWQDVRFTLPLFVPAISLKTALANDFLAVISGMILLCCIIGWLRCLFLRRGILEIWLPIAIAFLFVPSNASFRYWFTFLPFLIYYFLQFASLLDGRAWLPIKFFSYARFSLFLSMGFGLALLLFMPDNLRYIESSWKDFGNVAQWAGKHLPANSVVIERWGAQFYASSGIFAINPENFGERRDEVLSTASEIFVLCSSAHSICENMKVGMTVYSAGSYELKKYGE
ncbi:hypothetical protein Thiowin_02745 [Thiorhodovibrio winogradskyi]|uniref:Glycosyltransferase RgtA/B/C/D-like domain-containing protein n=1 Tax=Thiorhodovibrio winogradskyi TaxID=77007 RepID=A0ABZ0S9J5_9GAMM|nr:glycosyltransferase family 39 protein [Thiorhodovibrio winogradskyi]